MNTNSPQRFIPQSLETLRQPTKILAAAGALVLAVGLLLAPGRAWSSLLLGSFALLCLGLAGLFFVAQQYASGAVWSIALRRVGESMAASLPAGAAGVLLVLIAHPSTYSWYGHAVTEEGWLGFRQAWLSNPFFLARAVVYCTVWLGFSWAIRKNSREQDSATEIECSLVLSRKNTRLSVVFLIAFAITFWLASTD